MQTLPVITEADIQALSSSESFQRGKEYYRQGALFELVQQGNGLRGYCEGSGYEPYRVTVTLSERGIAHTACTCPYDWGGICKHRVALLLAWAHEPESFQSIPPLDELLAGRSKEELIILIKEMIKRSPELARVLELPVQPDRQTPLDLEAFRRQIGYALRQGDRYDYDYPDASTVATELSSIVETAQRFQEGGDWENAGALYALILNEVVPRYNNLYDDDGDVSLVLQECAEGLDACLTEGEADVKTRRIWLEALLNAELKNVEMGGIDLASPAAEIVINHATDEEWEWIEEKVRQTLANKTGPYSDWARQSLVGFLAERLEAQGQEEEVDELILQQGTPQQQAYLLVERGRFEEAVAIAKAYFAAYPGLISSFADALVSAGAGELAEAYMKSLLDSHSQITALIWLTRYAQQTGRLTLALEWQWQMFREQPSFETYKALRELAQQLGEWAQLRSKVITELEAKQAWHVLIEIALDEGEVRQALALLSRAKNPWVLSSYELRVAQAAEADYPQTALQIYLPRVETFIQGRNRSSYHEAAGLLVRIRDLYQRQGQANVWQKYITQLREQNRRLPALMDELRKAGL